MTIYVGDTLYMPRRIDLSPITGSNHPQIWVEAMGSRIDS